MKIIICLMLLEPFLIILGCGRNIMFFLHFSDAFLNKPALHICDLSGFFFCLPSICPKRLSFSYLLFSFRSQHCHCCSFCFVWKNSHRLVCHSTGKNEWLSYLVPQCCCDWWWSDLIGWWVTFMVIVATGQCCCHFPI